MFPTTGNMDMGDPTAPYQATNVTSGDPMAMRNAMMVKGLRGQKQPQGQMVGGHYIAPSAGEALTPLISQLGSAYFGGMGGG